MPPRNVQLTSNWPIAPDSKRISAIALSSASIGCTSVSAQHITSSGPVLLADEVADDLDAVAAEVDDRPAARLLRVPEPRAVRAGMRLARARPHHLADLAGLRPPAAPSASSACRRGPRGSRRRCRRARRCRASASPPPRVRASGFVQSTALPCFAQSSTASSWRWFGRPMTTVSVSGCAIASSRSVVHSGHVVLGAERARPLLGARVDDVHAVAVALAVQRHRVEEADQAGPEHRHLVTVHAVRLLLDAVPQRG